MPVVDEAGFELALAGAATRYFLIALLRWHTVVSCSFLRRPAIWRKSGLSERFRPRVTMRPPSCVVSAAFAVSQGCSLVMSTSSGFAAAASVRVISLLEWPSKLSPSVLCAQKVASACWRTLWGAAQTLMASVGRATSGVSDASFLFWLPKVAHGVLASSSFSSSSATHFLAVIPWSVWKCPVLDDSAVRSILMKVR